MRTFSELTNEVNALYIKQLQRVVRIAHKKGGRDNLKNEANRKLYDEAISKGITLESATAAFRKR